VRRISRYLPLLFVLFCGIQFASAQSAFDLNLGFGAIQDKASSTQVDQELNTCTTGDLYPPCVSTPALSGFMMGFGGDLMLWKKLGGQLGVGAEVGFQPAKENYINLNASAAASGLSSESIQSRMTLFDFNGIYEPVNNKKVTLKLEGGIGVANLKFYESGSSSSGVFRKCQPLSGARRRGRADLCQRQLLHSPGVRCPLRSQPDAVWKQHSDGRDGVGGI